MTNSKSIENSLQTKNVWQKILKNDVLKEKYAWHCDHIIVKMSKIQWYPAHFQTLRNGSQLLTQTYNIYSVFGVF